MSKDNDFKWFALIFIALAAGMAVSLSVKDYAEGKVGEEAIKAGLVQDPKGHWVKPEAPK